MLGTLDVFAGESFEVFHILKTVINLLNRQVNSLLWLVVAGWLLCVWVLLLWLLLACVCVRLVAM